jgi:hypothetical protein
VKASVRYLEARRLADGATAYYYCPPKVAVDARVVGRCALGKDFPDAVRKAEAYNAVLDAWRGDVPLDVENRERCAVGGHCAACWV